MPISVDSQRTRSPRRLLPLLCAMLLSAACAAPEPAPDPTPSQSARSEAPAGADLDAAGLEELGAVNVFFAHRSVGADIIEMGFPAVYQDLGVVPPTTTFRDHWLDQTEDPASKLADFDHQIRDEGLGEWADVAVMKLGYVDILADTDVEDVFDRYRSMMDALEADYPAVVFLHVTVSVTAWVPENNAAIERFNVLMRDRYAPTGRLFDLAASVSTCEDGEPDQGKTAEGAPYHRICPEYTRDGGHLNELGAKVAAEDMLRALVAAIREQR